MHTVWKWLTHKKFGPNRQADENEMFKSKEVPFLLQSDYIHIYLAKTITLVPKYNQFGFSLNCISP